MAKIDELKFDDKNFNKHTEFGMSLLEKSLQEFGAGRSILVDKNNRVIAGNGILEAAGQVGIEDIKVIETVGDELVVVKRTDIDLDTKKGREMALADNATANADLSWDEDNIKEQTEKWDFDTSDWGMNFNFDKGIEVEDDEAPEANESEPAKSKLGEVYHLGNHRLMCGDSTDAASVAILMDGQKADMVFTDPPYNINFKDAKGRNIQNDNLGSNFDKFVDDIMEICLSVIEKGYIYICFSQKFIVEYLKTMLKHSIDDYDLIIWKKDTSMRLGKDYRNYYEPIWLFRIGKPDFFGNKSLEKNVWEINSIHSASSKDDSGNTWFNGRNKNLTLHPTQKPVAVPSKAISNSSRKDWKILDLFGGSGSTLIACEQLGRKCYMMELDPKYCDVIRKRYWKFITGSEEGWEDGTKAI